MTRETSSVATVKSLGRDVTTVSLLVFAFALVVRVLELWQLSSDVVFDLRMGDGRVYHLWARQIAAGDWLGDEVFYQAPLYPYFLAVIYRIAGESLLVVRLIQVILGATACALLTQAGWRLFSKRAGILAGVMLALYAPAMFSAVMIQKSVLDLFFVCLLLAIVSEIDTRMRPRLGSYLGLGLVIGGLILTRENTLVFVGVLLPWLLLRPGRSIGSRLGYGGLFLAGISLVLLPVAIRNWSLSGDFHLTTSQFGHNFFIGNNANADGTYAPLVYGRGDPLVEREDAKELVARALGWTPSPAEVSSFYTQRAIEYIRSDPAGWAALLWRKVMLAANAVELVDTEDQYTYAESSWILRLTGRVFHFGVLAPLAFLGVFVTWDRRGRLWPLYAMVMAYGGTLILFYIFGRYRLPIVPILMLFASAGLVGLRDFLHTHSRVQVAVTLALTVGVVVMANWPMHDPRYMRSVTHYNFGNELIESGRVDAGIRQYRIAIELYADNAVANQNLGAILARQGKLGVAQGHFEEALRIVPGYVQARFNLARVLAESYDLDGAIENYRLGLEIEPRRADIQVELGRLLRRRGKDGEAERCFVRALQLDRANLEALRELSELRADEEKVDR